MSIDDLEKFRGLGWWVLRIKKSTTERAMLLLLVKTIKN